MPKRKRKKPEVQERLSRITLENALWSMLDKLLFSVNAQLKGMGRSEVSTAELLSLIIKNALLENHADVQEEYTRLGLDRVAVQLAPLFGADGLAASGLPDVPDGGRAPRNPGTRLL